MTVCIVCIREPNPNVGGIEKVSYILARYWQKLGHKIVFVYAVPAPSISYENTFVNYHLAEESLSEESQKEKFVSILKEEQCDIILNQAIQCNSLVELCSYAVRSIPIKLVSAIHFSPHYELVAAFHNRFVNKFGENKSVLFNTKRIINDFFFFVNKRKLLKKEKDVLMKIGQDSDAIVVLSDIYIPEFKRLSGTSKVISIPNPIKPQQIEQIPSKQKVVLYVGRLEYGLKRVDRLLKIWQKVEKNFPDWCLKIVGDGDYGYSLRLLAHHLKLKNITFEGYQSVDDYYKAASILCLTSSAEGFGMVLVEAMQYGCVSVAYDSYTALSDIIDDGVNGYKVTAFKEDEFVEKLSSLMSNEGLREQMSMNALKTPQKFDASVIATRWIKLFENIL